MRQSICTRRRLILSMIYSRLRGLRPSFFNLSKGISSVVAWTFPLTPWLACETLCTRLEPFRWDLPGCCILFRSWSCPSQTEPSVPLSLWSVLSRILYSCLWQTQCTSSERTASSISRLHTPCVPQRILSPSASAFQALFQTAPSPFHPGPFFGFSHIPWRCCISLQIPVPWAFPISGLPSTALPPSADPPAACMHPAL